MPDPTRTRLPRLELDRGAVPRVAVRSVVFLAVAGLVNMALLPAPSGVGSLLPLLAATAVAARPGVRSYFAGVALAGAPAGLGVPAEIAALAGSALFLVDRRNGVAIFLAAAWAALSLLAAPDSWLVPRLAAAGVLLLTADLVYLRRVDRVPDPALIAPRLRELLAAAGPRARRALTPLAARIHRIDIDLRRLDLALSAVGPADAPSHALLLAQRTHLAEERASLEDTLAGVAARSVVQAMDRV